MPQYKLFSGFNEDELMRKVNTFLDENGFLFSNVDQEYVVTATNVVGLNEKIIYKHFILLKFKTTDALQTETFQGV